MAHNRSWLLGGMLAVSAGIVVAMVYTFGGGGDAKPVAGRERPATQLLAASGGVRAADVDSARRVDLDPNAGDEPRLPEIRPEARVGDRSAPQELPPPPPPMVLTEEQKAANAAHQALRGKVVKEVSKQLGSQSAALAKACGGGADFSVNATFDAGGQMLAMGISDVRGPNGDEAGTIGSCLRQQAIALSVASPGEGVTVDVPLHLP